MNYNKATFDRAFGISAQLPPADGIEIAFAGRSNVGKSSLLNRLFNRKSLARVSSVPGKTVTVNFYDVDGVHFVDLPGYGYAKISKAEKKRFGELMEGYFQSGRPIRLVVQLIDMRHAPTADDLQMIDFLQQIGLPFVVVLTVLAAVVSFLFCMATAVFVVACVVLTLLAVALFISGQTLGGIVFLVLAFLISPYGIPAIAEWLVDKLHNLNFALRGFITG